MRVLCHKNKVLSKLLLIIMTLSESQNIDKMGGFFYRYTVP